MTERVGLHRPLCPDGRAAAAPPCTAPCPERARPFVLAATILASAMAFIDGSIVTIALPTLQAGLGASFAALQWVVNAYALLLGGLILVGGAAGDRLGRRRLFVIGIALFAAASLGCALAPTVELLIVARGIQGIGAALLVPQSLAIIAAAFPRDVRGRAIGIWASASAITTALGPPLGGFLIDWVGWRAVFWINLPLSVLAIWLALEFVPESRADTDRGPLDWSGGALSVLAFGALTGGLTLLTERTAGLVVPVLLLGIGIVGLGLLIRNERTAANPLMPPSLFASRDFTGANLMTLLLYGALSAALFLLPFDLMERRGYTSTEVGLTLLPFGLVIGALSRVTGAWADRAGARPPLVVGSVLVGAAASGLALTVEPFWIGVLVPILVMALGMAFVAAPLTTAVMNAAPDKQAGAASGVNNAASRLAGLFGVVIVGAAASVVFFNGLERRAATGAVRRFGELPAASDPGRPALEAAFVEAYSVAMWLAAAACVLAALIALVYVSGKQTEEASAG